MYHPNHFLPSEFSASSLRYCDRARLALCLALLFSWVSAPVDDLRTGLARAISGCSVFHRLHGGSLVSEPDPSSQKLLLQPSSQSV